MYACGFFLFFYVERELDREGERIIERVFGLGSKFFFIK